MQRHIMVMLIRVRPRECVIEACTHATRCNVTPCMRSVIWPSFLCKDESRRGDACVQSALQSCDTCPRGRNAFTLCKRSDMHPTNYIPTKGQARFLQPRSLGNVSSLGSTAAKALDAFPAFAAVRNSPAKRSILDSVPLVAYPPTVSIEQTS